MFRTKSLKSLVAAGVLALLVGGASATTIDFDTHHSGLNVGAVTLGTLAATQVGTDVEFVYTNTAVGFDPGHTTQLFLTYLGIQMSVTLSDIDGVATSSFSSSTGFTNAGLTFQFEIGWPTSNQGNGTLRLNPGESSTFRLLNTTLAGFFQGENSAMIHIQGLTNGGSAKYLGTLAAVPLPAAGFLLLAALGGLGVASRRRRTV